MSAKMADDPLRAALNVIWSRVGSVKQLLELAKGVGCESKVGVPWLTQWLNFNLEEGGSGNSLGPERREPLERFAFRTPLGRALRGPAGDSGRILNPIFERLLSGAADKEKYNPSMSIFGNYYMYHGSYIRNDHVIIRMLSISKGEDDAILVTDVVRDFTNKDARGKPIYAYGVLTFEGDYPQIVLKCSENKKGISIIACHKPFLSVDDIKIEQISGNFVVLTRRNEVRARRTLIVPEANQKPSAMLKQTRIYHLDEIAKMPKKHQNAFAILRKHRDDDPDQDPIDKFDINICLKKSKK